MKVNKEHVCSMLDQLLELKGKINPAHRHISGMHIIDHLNSEKLEADILGSFGLPNTKHYIELLHDLYQWTRESIVEELEKEGQEYLNSTPRTLKELLVEYKGGNIGIDEVIAEANLPHDKYSKFLLEEMWLDGKVDIDVLVDEVRQEEKKRALLRSTISELRILFEDEVEQNPFEQY